MKKPQNIVASSNKEVITMAFGADKPKMSLSYLKILSTAFEYFEMFASTELFK